MLIQFYYREVQSNAKNKQIFVKAQTTKISIFKPLEHLAYTRLWLEWHDIVQPVERSIWTFLNVVPAILHAGDITSISVFSFGTTFRWEEKRHFCLYILSCEWQQLSTWRSHAVELCWNFHPRHSQPASLNCIYEMFEVFLAQGGLIGSLYSIRIIVSFFHPL